MVSNNVGMKLVESPIVTIFIELEDSNSKTRLFNKLKEFANKNLMAARIDEDTVNKGEVKILLWREDIKIRGSNPFDENKYRFPFYQNNSNLAFSMEEVRRIKENMLQVVEGKGITVTEIREYEWTRSGSTIYIDKEGKEIFKR